LHYFIFTATSTTAIYTLSLHDALPILHDALVGERVADHLLQHLERQRRDVRTGEGCLGHVLRVPDRGSQDLGVDAVHREDLDELDRKSTRLNSSHVSISYAVFCLKKKT